MSTTEYIMANTEVAVVAVVVTVVVVVDGWLLLYLLSLLSYPTPPPPLVDRESIDWLSIDCCSLSTEPSSSLPS